MLWLASPSGKVFAARYSASILIHHTASNLVQNWQVSTRSRVVKNGKLDQITREPEQVRAFRDTWKDGVHSYLSYLRDRLTCMRDLICDKGSIFVQIGEENVHRVRALMDEVFGERNFVSLISFE